MKRAIKVNTIHAGLLNLFYQRLYFLAQSIEDLQHNIATHRQLVFNGRGGIERIRIVVAKGELPGRNPSIRR